VDGGDIEALRFCYCRTPFYTEEGWDVNRISLLRIMVASSVFLSKISSETLGIFSQSELHFSPSKSMSFFDLCISLILES